MSNKAEPLSKAESELLATLEATIDESIESLIKLPDKIYEEVRRRSKATGIKKLGKKDYAMIEALIAQRRSAYQAERN